MDLWVLSPACGRTLFPKTRSIIDGKAYQDIMDVRLFHYDGEVCLRNATTNEVAQAKWIPPAQIRELNDSGSLVKNLAYFFTEVESTEG